MPKTLTITFTTDHTFSPDGVDILHGRKGEDLELEATRAQELVDRGVAKPKAEDEAKPKAKPRRRSTKRDPRPAEDKSED